MIVQQALPDRHLKENGAKYKQLGHYVRLAYERRWRVKIYNNYRGSIISGDRNSRICDNNIIFILSGPLT